MSKEEKIVDCEKTLHIENDKDLFFIMLSKDFIQSAEVSLIQNIPDGKEILWLYVRLVILSLDFNGKLIYGKSLIHNYETIASLLNYDVILVRKALDLFLEYGWIEILANNCIHIKYKNHT